MDYLAFILYLIIGICAGTACHEPRPSAPSFINQDSVYKVMFYNVENLFDVADDPNTLDEDFTPAGKMHWTSSRYDKKINNVCKVIIACGGWQPPDIVGLCEIENHHVLRDLVYFTSLSAFSFGIVHQDSPDRRGIDVALLYNKQKIRYLDSRSISVKLGTLTTRDILYVKLLLGKDTSHIFVNHWPSRSDGQLGTEAGRIAAARTLKQLTDSLFKINPFTTTLIMGDLNDEPHDKSLIETLRVGNLQDIPVPAQLYNLTSAPASGKIRGTLKYQGNWNTFDQIIVSGNLLAGEKGLTVNKNSYGILQNFFLLEEDEMYSGYKPFRTYSGYKYRGGFSDHLPVYTEIIYRR